MRVHVLLQVHLCTDLHEIWNLRSQDSIWPPCKISRRSKLWLWRYLQNNTGVCLILNFQCILHILTIWASKFFKNAAKRSRQHARIQRRSSSTEGPLPLQVVFHRRLSSDKGCLSDLETFSIFKEFWCSNCENM